MTIKQILNIPPSSRTLKYFTRHYPDFVEELVRSYPSPPFPEQLYLYINNLCQAPCCTCGKKLSFLSVTRGYTKYCSYVCANRTNAKYGEDNTFAKPETKDKIKRTCLERYGVDNPGKSKELREKTKQTNIERYGAVGFASPELAEKTKQTNIERYGCEHPASTPEIKEKIIQTWMEKYGVSNPQQSDKIQRKIKQTFLETHPQIINRAGRTYLCKCPHEECDRCTEHQYEIDSTTFWSRIHVGAETCTHLLPLGKCGHSSLELTIKSILDKYGIAYEATPNSSILHGKHIDIYCPEHKIGIEVNGIYWHSTVFKSHTYHAHKYELAKKNGVQLLTIWEDWIRNNPTALESLLLSKFHIYKDRIGASRCKVVELTQPEANEVLQHHIQGPGTSPVRLGLKYKDHIVAVMTFCRTRKSVMGSKEDAWELQRFCCEPGTQVVGGASRLLKNFIKRYNPSKIVSFSSNDISTGELYKTLGFQRKTTNISYWVVTPKFKRYHRYILRKSERDKVGFVGNESDYAEHMGWYIIYDSGTQTWELTL